MALNPMAATVMIEPAHRSQRRRIVGFLAGVLLVCGATGCVAPPVPSGGMINTPSRVVPANLLNYVLAPGDEIEITFRRTPELNQRELIRPDGAISVTDADARTGEKGLVAANLTVQQLRGALVQLYQSELKDPDISVTIRTFGSNTVYVAGEVGRPGMLPLTGAMSALQAVLAAEGFKSSARTGEVLLIRPAGSGRASWQILNLGKAFGRADLGDDVRLAPHDILYVPRSHIGNADEFVDLYIRRLLPIQPGIQVPLS